jgi:hypothetical protein
MKKFFGNLEIMVDDPFGDQKTGEGELFADLKVLCEMKREFGGTAS